MSNPNAEKNKAIVLEALLLVSELVVVRALHTSALSENLKTAFKIRADSRNALLVCNAIRFNLN